MVLGKNLNIVVTGVGGQWLITLATVLANSAVESGTYALVAETHGLSQRGGSVEVHVRLGDVIAPLVPKGGADIVLGLELIETARCAHYVKENGYILASDMMLRPGIPNVSMPKREDLISFLRSVTENVYVIPATKIAEDLGGSIFMNSVMLGALAATGLLKEFVKINILENNIKRLRMGEKNLRAFQLGFSYCQRNCRNDKK
jgi:indolepyruvate ferredoxin oxidoreductase beta subunit